MRLARPLRRIFSIVSVVLLAACGTHMGSEVDRAPLQDQEMVFFYDIVAYDLDRKTFRKSVPGQFWKTLGNDELVLDDTALMPLGKLLYPDPAGAGQSYLGIVRGPAKHQYLYWSGDPFEFFWSSRQGEQISFDAQSKKAVYIGSITYLFSKGKFGIRIFDNYPTARAEFLAAYPEFEGMVVKQLARKGWRSGMILANREHQNQYINSVAAQAAVMGAMIGSQ